MRLSPWSAALPALVLACGGEDLPAPPPLPVTVTTVANGGGGGETRYAGAIQADARVDVAFRMSGIVDQITQVRGADGRPRALQDGDLVGRGTVLARLRQSEFRDQVTDAEASFRQAQADYERAAQLYENRSVSKAEYDAAYARYTAGQAKQSQAAISLGDATLRSPIDGVILRRSVEVGSLAGPSAAAFTVADTRIVKVVFGVPDVVVSGLELGGQLAIQAEALPGEVLQGRITRISPSADPNSRVFEVEASLSNPGGKLRVGMLATLRLGETDAASELHIPLAAVIRPAGDSAGYAVFVARDSSGHATARLRRVELGDVSGNQIAVRDGLEPGERIVVRGATIVADGQRVRVIP
ncbi:MAG TPA: efflux RND transporter periplasmic adaptor subunit [Gemmatimonadales bacterium]|nr:efflux RND transporter periplasmic adaptor subunit [Gemmatimonadales bacterium]